MLQASSLLKFERTFLSYKENALQMQSSFSAKGFHMMQAEDLSEIGHNLTSALPMPPMPAGMTMPPMPAGLPMPPRPGQAMPPMPPRPPGTGMPQALSSSGPNGNMNAAGSQVLGAWDLFSNFGQALSNFMSATLHVSVGT